MDSKSDWKEKTVRFCKESAKFEKKKLILPTLMVILLLSSLLYGFNLRDNQNIDQRIAHSNRDVMTNLSVNFVKESNYPNQSGIKNQTQLEKINRENAERVEKRTENLFGPEEIVPLLPAGLATESITYPLAPETLIGPHHFELSNPLFAAEKGYVASEEIPNTITEVFYISKKLSDLSKRINSSNLSYSNFQSGVEEIRSSTYRDEKVREKAFSQEIGSPQADAVPTGLGLTGDLGSESAEEKIIQNIKDKNLKEIGLIHFIPTFFASFVMYYLLSGVVITGWRDFKEDVEEFSKREGFFRNNLVLSGLLSSTISFLAILGFYTYSNSNLVVLTLQFFVSSVFWLVIFAVVVNELRKKTKFAWILSGIGNTILLLLLAAHFEYNQEFIRETFIIGATPIYPLLLGIFSEYGRIHGEKFLRKKLRDD